MVNLFLWLFRSSSSWRELLEDPGKTWNVREKFFLSSPRQACNGWGTPQWPRCQRLVFWSRMLHETEHCCPILLPGLLLSSGERAPSVYIPSPVVSPPHTLTHTQTGARDTSFIVQILKQNKLQCHQPLLS